ncbi:MAG: hypothetical protein V4719_00905 [Planctomycetota bacterium]
MNAVVKNIKVDGRTHASLWNTQRILDGRRCEHNPNAAVSDRLTISEVAEMAIMEGIKVLLSKRDNEYLQDTEYLVPVNIALPAKLV